MKPPKVKLCQICLLLLVLFACSPENKETAAGSTFWYLTGQQSQQSSESSKKPADQAALIKTDVFKAGTNNYSRIFGIPA